MEAGLVKRDAWSVPSPLRPGGKGGRFTRPASRAPPPCYNRPPYEPCRLLSSQRGPLVAARIDAGALAGALPTGAGRLGGGRGAPAGGVAGRRHLRRMADTTRVLRHGAPAALAALGLGRH